MSQSSRMIRCWRSLALWRAMLTVDDYAAAHGGDRSRAEIAFAAAAMRAGINDGTIARCLMDERRPFGSNTRASERLLSSCDRKGASICR